MSVCVRVCARARVSLFMESHDNVDTRSLIPELFNEYRRGAWFSGASWYG